MVKGKKRSRTSHTIQREKRRISKKVREMAVLAETAYKRGHQARSKNLDEYLGDDHNWKIDNWLSDTNTAIFVDHDKKHVVTSNKGTSTLPDLLTDTALVFGAEKATKHFKQADKKFKQVRDKYKDYKHTLVGHSLGGAVNLHVYEKHKDHIHTVHNFNPGSAASAIVNKANPNTKNDKKVKQHFIEGDVISISGHGDANYSNHYYKPIPGTNPHTITQFTQ